MGLADLEARFTHLKPIAGSVAEKIHAIVSEAAAEINKLANESPALMSIIQHLEQVVQIAVTSPHLAEPVTADPTSAEPASPGLAPNQSPESISTGPSPSSAGGSTP